MTRVAVEVGQSFSMNHPIGKTYRIIERRNIFRIRIGKYRMLIQEEFEKLAQAYPVLQELPPGLQHRFADLCYPIEADAGKVLFDIDVTIQSFTLLTQGTIRVIQPAIERELVLYRVQPGGCCAISISHLLGDTRYRARAVVESPIQGVALPRPLFQAMIEQSPSFYYFILHGFSDRFIQLLDLIGRITSMRLDQRLARVLASRGPIIQMTHIQLADELGSVREVISRILKDFEGKGLIKVERGKIEVVNQEALLQMCQMCDSDHRQ